MYELFIMAIKEYWNNHNESQEDTNKEITDLQNVLSQAYGYDVSWPEPDPDPAKGDDEINVCAFSDAQFSSLQAMAAALELDGNLDELEDMDPSQPWDSSVFERLDDLEDEDGNPCAPKKFPTILSLASMEAFIVPSKFDTVTVISMEDENAEECDCHHDHDCDCDDDCCCCCDDDESSTDIASLYALRKELDLIGKAANLKNGVTLDEIDDMEFEDDSIREGKICWYILSSLVDQALEAKLPLIMNYNPDEGDDIENEDD